MAIAFKEKGIYNNIMDADVEGKYLRKWGTKYETETEGKKIEYHGQNSLAG